VNSITISDEESKENEETCLAYPVLAPVKRKRKPGPASEMKNFRRSRGLSVGRGHQLTEHIALGAVTALFRARNVTLLQKVYAWDMGKLEQAKEDKQLIAMFMASGLADIGK
jgi:hypothetical protein